MGSYRATWFGWYTSLDKCPPFTYLNYNCAQVPLDQRERKSSGTTTIFTQFRCEALDQREKNRQLLRHNLLTIYLGTPHALDRLVHFLLALDKLGHFLTFAMKGITSRMHEIDLHSRDRSSFYT
jgi:hypothetical protein|uniref:Uncharacterized protein n=1 Tax=Picea glauca TaxID=3330 RepID=A0A101LYI8_PICGL|nr:hypothetical protein ABT39_MTgene5884 [Picea glauca]QHR92090.1 hypothetical protein Q903MT_gene6126 [Picea sitchensis]